MFIIAYLIGYFIAANFWWILIVLGLIWLFS